MPLTKVRPPPDDVIVCVNGNYLLYTDDKFYFNFGRTHEEQTARIRMIVVLFSLVLILKAFEGNGRSQIYRTHTAIDAGAWILVVNAIAKNSESCIPHRIIVKFWNQNMDESIIHWMIYPSIV